MKLRHSARFVLTLAVALIGVRAVAKPDSTAAKNLNQMSGPELLHCALSSECEYGPWDLANTLGTKFTVNQLIDMYPHEPHEAQEIIIMSLTRNKSASVIAVMRQAAFTDLKPGMTDEDNHYFALQYLADRCDPDALRELNRPENFKDSYPVGCISWQYTLADFGKCAYHPAIALLAVSLDSACVNNIVAAEDSLRHLLPKSSCWKLGGLSGNFQAETACYLKQVGSSAHH